MKALSRITLMLIVAFYSALFSSVTHAAISPVSCGLFKVEPIILIGLDDLLVPVPTAPKTPNGVCYQADFNGDGILDLLVQGLTASDETVIYLGDNAGKYRNIQQRWSNTYLGLNWGANASTLYIADYDADGKLDVMVASSSAISGILYADTNYKYGSLAYTWAQTPSSSSTKPIVVGIMAGGLDVSGGAAGYSIPIDTPPGIAGMAPQVSLNYSSQGGNGLMGMGWSIGGLSAISRCSRTIVQDGVVGGINFDANDRFCLDGQRLVNAIGGYGSSGTEYRTEIESFSRVYSYGNTGGAPSYFTVETKAGLKMYFGNSANSFVKATGKAAALAWKVNRIEDKNGNYISFVYYQDSSTGESYPLRIDYTGNRSQAPNRAIAFIYDTSRIDPAEAYIVGSKVKSSWRLKNVKTYSNFMNNQMVYDYQLGYESSLTTGRSRLTSVQKCAPTTCLNPTTFNWENKTAGYTNGSAYIGGIGQKLFVNNVQAGESVDINGDGLLDIFHHDGSRNLYRNTGSGFVQDNTRISGIPYAFYNASFQRVGEFIDLNGDGLQDVLINVSGVNRAYLNLGLSASENQGYGYGFYEYPPYAPGAACSLYLNGKRQGEVVDLNGDGLSDILISSNSGTRACINSPSGFYQADSYVTALNFPLYVDGKPRGTLTDLNGDGLVDMFISYEGGIHGYINNGSSFVKDNAYISGATVPLYVNDKVQGSVVDLNGDNLADLLISYEGATNSFINTGRGFIQDASYASGLTESL